MSSPINAGEFSSINEEEGNSTLINGTENYQICYERFKSKNATAEAASQCDGWFYKDAASNKELLLSRGAGIAQSV
jgi:hypothetical protein